MRSLFAFQSGLALVHNPDVGAGQDSLERAIIGGLKSAIRDHGPITTDNMSSAAKRIAGNLKNARLDGLAAALGRRGGLANQSKVQAAKGRKGGRAGKGTKKPHSPEAHRRHLARRLIRAAGDVGSIDAEQMRALAPGREELHVTTALAAAAAAFGVTREVQELLAAG